MEKSQYHVIGLMSGTSLDGIDLCEVIFQKDQQWHFEILNTSTVNYSENWQKKLKHSVHLAETDLNQLDEDYSAFLASEIAQFISRNHIKDIDAICSHGHTVFHQPNKGLTKQIGNRKSIAEITKNKVVCDFRVQDVALGGQGAPLVPIGDKLLFEDYAYCLNLGGFANVSFDDHNKRMAFDICPANIVLNHYAQALGFTYDENGENARKGELNMALFDALNALNFYEMPYPKSLGVEWVNSEVLTLINSFKLPVHDILRTFVEHIAYQMSLVVQQKHDKNILITGGGAYNSFLIERIGDLTSNSIVIPTDELINYKEALIFGLLGVLKLRNDVNCLSSVTGAKYDHSSGKIFLP